MRNEGGVCRGKEVLWLRWRERVKKFLYPILSLSLSVCTFGSRTVAAQDQARDGAPPPGTRGVLSRELEVEFAPEAGFFVVQFDSAPPIEVQAVVMPAAQRSPQRQQGVELARWLVGGLVELPPGAVMMRSFGVVRGNARQSAPLPLVVQEISRLPFGGDSEPELRAHLMNRKGEVSKLRQQMTEQEATLGRLREDAELVGNFARVVDAQEELAKVKALTQSVEKDIANLERFLRLAASYPVPRNYRNREQQLAGQLKELTEAARRAEQGEFTRRQFAQGATQNRLRQLEASRTGDIPALEEQLAILRAERQRLEPATPDDL